MRSWINRVTSIAARFKGRRALACVAVEFRSDAVRALRMANGRVERAETVDCRAQERRTALERMRRAGWFEGADVQLVLGTGQRQLNSTPRPPVDDADLREALRWQLRDALEYPPEEAVLDALPVADTEPAGRQEVLVFSIRRQELMQLVGAFSEAGVRVTRVTAIDCAQRNLAWHWIEGGAAAALLMPCDGGALCTVSLGEQLILSRAIEIDGEAVVNERKLELTAERMALQMQRSFDLLERRSADATVATLVAADWGSRAALFARISALTAQRVHAFDLDALLPGILPADAALDLRPYLHLLGACLIDPPAAGSTPPLRSLAVVAQPFAAGADGDASQPTPVVAAEPGGSDQAPAPGVPMAAQSEPIPRRARSAPAVPQFDLRADEPAAAEEDQRPGPDAAFDLAAGRPPVTGYAVLEGSDRDPLGGSPQLTGLGEAASVEPLAGLDFASPSAPGADTGPAVPVVEPPDVAAGWPVQRFGSEESGRELEPFLLIDPGQALADELRMLAVARGSAAGTSDVAPDTASETAPSDPSTPVVADTGSAAGPRAPMPARRRAGQPVEPAIPARGRTAARTGAGAATVPTPDAIGAAAAARADAAADAATQAGSAGTGHGEPAPGSGQPFKLELLP